MGLSIFVPPTLSLGSTSIKSAAKLLLTKTGADACLKVSSWASGCIKPSVIDI